MAYTFSNPGVWAEGASVTKGDIYMVTESDAKNNSSYTAGDFYTAEYTGGIQYYPPYRESDSYWTYTERKWMGSTSVSVALIGNPGESVNLYGNGLCMLPVRVYMTALDNSKPVGADFIVSDEDMTNAVTLVDLDTGKKYQKKTSPPKVGDEDTMGEGGYFCTTPGEFVVPTGAVSSSATSDPTSARQYITLYFFYKSNQISTFSLRLGCILVPKDNPAATVYNYKTSGANVNGSDYIGILSKKIFSFGENGDVFASLVSANPWNGMVIDKYYIDIPGVTGMKYVELLKTSIPPQCGNTIPDDCFHLYTAVDYISCAIFTDSKTEPGSGTKKIPEIYYPGSVICGLFSQDTFACHEKRGVCVAVARWWKAGLRNSYDTSGKGDGFVGGGLTMRDEYGNKCKISFNCNDGNTLTFNVI